MKEKIQSLFWGIIAAGTALFIELVLYSFIGFKNFETSERSFMLIIFLSVIIEEAIKYTTVLRQLDPLSFGRSAIINSWIAGIGFSLVEIAVFFQKIQAENLLFNQLDLFKISLLHILTFGIFGYKISLKETSGIDFKLIASLIIIHFSYNISIQYQENIGYPIDILILLILASYSIYGLIIVNKKLAQ